MSANEKLTKADWNGSEHVLTMKRGAVNGNYWRDLWLYRELFLVFAWRDMSVRYKQSVIGVGWALIRPLLTMVIFTIVFGRIAHLPTQGAAPYPIMVMTGILPWFLFSTILGDASQSVVGNANMIQKVYYPRIMTPVASACTAVVDFLISLAVLAIFMAFYRFSPDVRVLALPLFILLAIIASLGPALLFAALNVEYRDFRFIVPFIAQFGLYVSPVGYSSEIVPAKWRLLYSCNPMVAVIDGFRWSLLADPKPLYWPGMAIGIAVSLAFMVIGFMVFRRTEKTFADVV
jgi:lipopolysaccharide transport system permease protein